VFACAIVIGAAAHSSYTRASDASAGSVLPTPFSIAFVPLDDRPVTYQLPVALGTIAGQRVVTPPRALLGNYLQPGDGDAILAWLNSPETDGANALVASLDMIAYGGLVAARVPDVSSGDAYARLRTLAAARSRRSLGFAGAFGTIMRLAPTGVPQVGAARAYYATGDTVDDLQAYANLPDPPVTQADRDKAERLRQRIGRPVLARYLAARARDRRVDEWALQLAAEGGFDRIVLGQDDAGPTGLHLRDVAALRRVAHDFALGDRASIEPGADELGMVLLAQAFARNVRWRPTVRVVYSRPDGGSVSDRLEFEPVDATIERLIAACGAARVATGGDIALFVRVSDTSDADERTFEDAIAEAAPHGGATVADLTFLDGDPGPAQRALTDALVARELAGRLDGFASWNTDANTVGTALAVAIAAGAGRRAGRLDERALAQFMLNRYIDDYAFHQFVRPQLNRSLRAEGIDTSLLLPAVARQASSANRAALWPHALELMAKIYPQYRDGGLTITLPWDRTFETQIDVRLKPVAP